MGFGEPLAVNFNGLTIVAVETLKSPASFRLTQDFQPVLSRDLKDILVVGSRACLLTYMLTVSTEVVRNCFGTGDDVVKFAFTRHLDD